MHIPANRVTVSGGLQGDPLDRSEAGTQRSTGPSFGIGADPGSECGACGQGNPAGSRFCNACGLPLIGPGKGGAQPPLPGDLAEKVRAHGSPEGERKQITVMFADVARSMELAATVEGERWREILLRFLAIASRAVHSVEGTVHQFTGDGVMALFGAPLAHEDHAKRACIAALELQRELDPFSSQLAREEGIEFRVRCGLNSGEAIVGSIGPDLRMDYASIGNTNGLAKRMESFAQPGSIALSASTAALVEGEFELRALGERDVEGVTEPIPVFVLLGGAPAPSLEAAGGERGLSSFVGRTAEQASLEASVERALAGEGRIVGICGEPGVGKSRLVQELAHECRRRGMRIDSGRALAHGRAVPLLAALAMLRGFLGVSERDRPEAARERIEATVVELDPSLAAELPLLYDFLGVADSEHPMEQIDPEARQRRLLALVGRLLQARSAHEPGLIVVEDLHWLDSASALFLEALADAVPATRTLLVVTFRPGHDPGWGTGPTYEFLPLAPLDATGSLELLVKLLGDDPSLDGLAELISDRTRGNPLFIEEVVRALTETGSLTGERGAYRLTGKLEKLAIPPTVQAVLGARIDRLSTREKALLQSMSVIGEQVPEPILREVCELEENELGAALEALAVAELLGTEPSQGEREYSFKHPLTREVAYGSQLSEPRSQAHAAVAAAIERLYPDGLEERAALLAHHHEAAGAMREAAGWHARAAVWIANSSPTEGMERWRRLRELTAQLDSSAALRRLAVHARVAILGLGFRVGISYEEAVDVHAEGLRLLSEGTREAPDSPARAQLDASFASCLFWGGREREGFELLRAASAAAARSGDPGGAMGNASLAGSAAWVLGSFREGIEIVGRALSVAADDLKASAATLSGRRSTYAHCLWIRGACGGSLGGLDGALRDFERSLEVAGEAGDPEAELFVYCFRALLQSDVLQPGRGLADAEQGAGLAERIGNDLAIVIAFQALAGLRSECGDFGAGCEAAERALAICRERGVGLTWEPDILKGLAEASLGLEEVEKGRAAAEEAVAIAERRSLKRAAVQARLSLAKIHLGAKDTADFGRIATALEGALATATETGYRAIEPRIHLALAAFARLRADETEATREEERAARILNTIGAPAEEISRIRSTNLDSALGKPK